MAEVPLVDLEVIVRYSLAIRQEVAPAEEVLAALDESRALVLSLMEGSGNGSGDDHPDQTDQGDPSVLEQDEPEDHGREPAEEVEEEDLDLAEEVAVAEDEVALDDLADSGADVDGTPGLDPEPAPLRRAPLAAGGAGRRDEVFGPADDEADQDWVDEVERIRQRRNRKARQEAEERQARQAALAAEARRVKQAEEARRVEAARQAEEEAREEEEARRVQQARRAERGLRAGKPRSGATARAQEARPPKPRADDLEDVLELPPPISADEAARRRAERRRRRSQG